MAQQAVGPQGVLGCLMGAAGLLAAQGTAFGPTPITGGGALWGPPVRQHLFGLCSGAEKVKSSLFLEGNTGIYSKEARHSLGQGTFCQVSFEKQSRMNLCVCDVCVCVYMGVMCACAQQTSVWHV